MAFAAPSRTLAGIPRRLAGAATGLVRALTRPPRRTPSRGAAAMIAWLGPAAVTTVAILASMVLLDEAVIRWMPPRDTPWLRPLAVFSDLGRNVVVLAGLGTALAVLWLWGAMIRTAMAGRVLASLAVRVAYLFAAVAVAGAMTRLIKSAVGRGRPSVGGEADAFLFSPFAHDVRFESFPSGHATAAFALAFAVSALWPRCRVAMWSFAVAIAASRIVLLAHHPGDVLGGALVGVVGAALVREWFAARRRAFFIRSDGSIASCPGPGMARLKRLAGAPAGP